MTALAKVLADDFVFVGGQERIEGLADKFQGVEIGGSAVAKYLDLDLDWEAPRGRRRRRGRIGMVESVASRMKWLARAQRIKRGMPVVVSTGQKR